ncbi:MAG: hypothetical protein RIA63_01565 [Cyclobacteriaceae bacterium]
MVKYFLITMLIVSQWAHAQHTDWATEFQTSFIDISGLFGLDEPAQVTTLRFVQKGFFVEGFHSFSWKEPGMTIQTFFTGGYTFRLDNSEMKSLSIGNGFAFNRVASNGSFLRPIFTFNWSLSQRQSLSVVGWMFLDTRKEALQPLNGGTSYIGHVYKLQRKSVEWKHEARLLYSHVRGVRNVAGVTDQVKLSLTKSKFYFFVNTGYSFYRSDHKTEFIYNAGAGKRF